MGKMKILVVGNLHPILFKIFKANKWQCTHLAKVDYNIVSVEIENYEGLIVRGLKVDKQLLDKAINLKFIGRAGSGLDKIDVEYASKKGVKVFNSPEGNADAVGEHCVGMVLSLLKNIAKSNQQLKNQHWDRQGNTGVELSAQTVAIIGYGNTGHAFAKKLSGFNCKVLAYDKYKKNYGDEYAVEASLKQIFKQATVVSLHLPLTVETLNYFSFNFYKHFVQPFWLINSSRGKVVFLKEVEAAFKLGFLKGAALDVFETEPLFIKPLKKQPMEYLLNNQNVLFTPHIAGVTKQSYKNMSKVLANKVTKCFVENSVHN